MGEMAKNKPMFYGESREEQLLMIGRCVGRRFVDSSERPSIAYNVAATVDSNDETEECEIAAGNMMKLHTNDIYL